MTAPRRRRGRPPAGPAAPILNLPARLPPDREAAVLRILRDLLVRRAVRRAKARNDTETNA